MTGRVIVRHRRLSSIIEPSNPAVDAVIRRLVPAKGREHDPASGELLIHGSRVAALLVALRERGIEVDEEGRP